MSHELLDPDSPYHNEECELLDWTDERDVRFLLFNLMCVGKRHGLTGEALRRRMLEGYATYLAARYDDLCVQERGYAIAVDMIDDELKLFGPGGEIDFDVPNPGRGDGS